MEHVVLNLNQVADEIAKMASEKVRNEKWETLRETIQELHDEHQDSEDITLVTSFLLNLMTVLDEQEKSKSNI